MLVRVLGSAAGGGFPQWNCGCPNCRGVRDGSLDARPRTQASAAISADGASWFLLNASPEIRAQIESFALLHPRAARHSPLAGILLTNGDLDACLGLLSLRESQPLIVYATPAVRRGFCEGNRFYRTLERFPDQLSWRDLAVDAGPRPLMLAEGKASGLTVEAVAVPGKVPLHLVGIAADHSEQNLALVIR